MKLEILRSCELTNPLSYRVILCSISAVSFKKESTTESRAPEEQIAIWGLNIDLGVNEA